MPIARPLLVQRCRKDSSLLKTIFDAARGALNSLPATQRSHSLTVAGGERVLAFLTAMGLELCETSLEEQQLRVIAPFLLEGLAPHPSDGALRGVQRKSCLMILAQLSRSTSLSSTFLNSIWRTLTQALRAALDEEAEEIALSLGILLAFQQVKLEATQVTQLLAIQRNSKSLLIHQFEQLSLKFDVRAAVRALVSLLIDVSPSGDPDLVVHMTTLLAGKLSDQAIAEFAISKLLSESTRIPLDFSTRALRFLSQRFPEAIDSVVAKSKEMGGGRSNNDLIKAALIDSPLMLEDTSLLLALRSPVDAVRTAAVNAFADKVDLNAPTTPDVVCLGEAVCDILKEQTFEVLSSAWREDILVRVAAHVSTSVLLSTFVASWQHWSSRLRFTKKASAILSAILECSSTPEVSAALQRSPIGSAWLFSTVCTTAQGSLLSGLPRDLSSKRRELIESLSSTAVECAKQLSHAFPFFKNITAKIIQKSATQDVLPKSIASLLKQDSEIFASEAEKLSSTTVDLISSLAVADLYDRVLKLVANDEQSASSVLRFHLPLLINLVSQPTSGVESKVCEYLTTAIGAIPANEKEYSWRSFGQFLPEFLADNDFEAPALKLLIALLKSQSLEYTGMLGTAMSTLFKSNPQLILLKIAYAQHLSDVNLRTAAVWALPPFVLSVSDGCVSSFVTKQLRPDVAYSLLLCLPLVFDGFNSPDKAIREASFELADAFKHLPPNTHLRFEKNEASSFLVDLPLADLVSFIGELCKRSQRGSVELPTASPFNEGSDVPAAQLSNMKGIVVGLIKVLGWHRPTMSAGLILLSQRSLSLREAWDIFSAIHKDQPEESAATSELYRVMFRAFRFVDDIDKATLSRVASMIVEMAKQKTAIRGQLLSIYVEKWALYMTADQRTSIFEALLSAQERMPGQQDIVNALVEAPLDSKSIIDSITLALSRFTESCSERVIDVTAANLEDESERGAMVPLQQLGSVLEVMNGHIPKVDATAFRTQLSSLLLNLFRVLAFVNRCVSISVVGAEYAKSLILDSARACIEVGGLDLINNSEKSATKIRKSKSVVEVYQLDQVSSDVGEILTALQSSKLVALQFSALNTLGALLSLIPTLVPVCISRLGKLLVSASSEGTFTKHGRSEREGLVEDILVKLHSILRNGSEQPVAPQHFLQPLCFHFANLSTLRRSYLVRVSTEILGDHSMPCMVSVLLCNSMSSYELEGDDTMSSNDFTGLILLSRAAQRKAQRALKNSKPQDLFRLALDFPLRKSGRSQVSNVIHLLRAADLMFREILSVNSSTDHHERTGVDVTMLVAYTKKLLSEFHPNYAHSDQSILCTLLLLHLEYIHGTLESRAFHRALVLVDSSGEFKLQSLLLEIAEESLQLVASVSDLAIDSSANHDSMIDVAIGHQNVHVSLRTFAVAVYDWCLDIIKSLQRLLDTPTFIAVLQELLDHEHFAIRQRAVQMLTERLSDAKIAQQSEEQSLYFDLFCRLRDIFRQCSSSLTDKAAPALKKSIGLMHSTVICLDVISKAMGRGPQWIDMLDEIFRDIVQNAVEIDQQLKSDGGSRAELWTDLLKLQSSIFLSTGTLCGILGARSLSSLPTLMNLTTETLVRLSDSALSLSKGGKNREKNMSHLKTLTLAVRSIISAITVIATEAPSFIHPYITSSIQAMLTVYASVELDEHEIIRKDIDRCFSAMSTHIPLRLVLPQLHFNITAILSQGYSQAQRFFEYLGTLWSTLDRNYLSSSLSDVSSLVIITLDYRRQYGASEMPESVDEAIVGSALEFCIKLTEAELKAFLIKLIEWKDLHDDDNSRKRYARGTTFFQLMSALCNKLQIIFVPLLIHVWPSALAALEDVAHLKSSKKRRSGADFDEQSRNSESLRQIQWVLESVKLACAYDNEGLVDEVCTCSLTRICLTNILLGALRANVLEGR